MSRRACCCRITDRRRSAIKGPAAKILRELGREVSALEVARYYTGLIDGLVIDDIDADLAPAIEALGMDVLVTATVMKTRADREKLASLTLQFASRLLNR
jgi:LPPG:FO 2-phospho-L-lactate transferase